jgi:hypothetical protein
MAGVFGPALAALAAATCLATPVSANGSRVNAGPFVGYIAPDYDVVNGRFSLRVGGMRTETLSSKIPWFLPRRYRVGSELTVTGTRLIRPARFVQSFAQAYSPTNPAQHTFPSIISPPATGCWRLTFRSGRATGTLVVLVRPRVRAAAP